MEKVDMSVWPRREVYGFFSGMSNPFYSVTFRQDVTALYQYVKARRLSFYYALTWACTQAINEVDAFHYAVQQGEIVRLNRREPSFTDLKPGADQFHIVTMPCDDSLDVFCRKAAQRSAAQRGFIDMSAETENLIYISCFPWVDLTGFTNERDLSAPGAAEDSIPRITWGKYTQQAGRTSLGMSVEVNHRFIDGLHIGQFSQALDRCMSRLHQLQSAKL